MVSIKALCTSVILVCAFLGRVTPMSAAESRAGCCPNLNVAPPFGAAHAGLKPGATENRGASRADWMCQAKWGVFMH